MGACVYINAHIYRGRDVDEGFTSSTGESFTEVGEASVDARA